MYHGARVNLITGNWIRTCDFRSAYPSSIGTVMNETAAPQTLEISDEKKKLLEPWIEQFHAFDLKDEERISVLFGIALGYCYKAGIDFEALLGATLLAERAKQVADKSNEEIEES
jgi:hypothetical protein